MSLLQKSEKRRIGKILDEEQKARFERAGLRWNKRLCEVTASVRLGDEDFMTQKWVLGDCTHSVIIDHIDNNRHNNPIDASNFQWLCRSHNVRKNPPHDRFAKNKFYTHHKLSESDVKKSMVHRDRGSESLSSKDLPEKKGEFRGTESPSHYISTSQAHIKREEERRGEREEKREKEIKEMKDIRKIRIPINKNTFFSDGDDLHVRGMEMMKNMVLKDMFTTVVKRIMRRTREANWSDLIDSAVQETSYIMPNGTRLSIVISTAEKWLRPLCGKHSGTAPFIIQRKNGEKIVCWKRDLRKQKDSEEVLDSLRNPQEERENV